VKQSVLTAVEHQWEAAFVTALETSARLTVVRRCADLADLMAAAGAGLAEVAVVSPGLRSLDRAALHDLARHGLQVAGAVQPGDEEGERRLRQMGVEVVVRADWPAHEIEQALERLAPAGGSAHGNGTRPAPEVSAAGGPPAHGEDEDGAVGRIVAVWGPTGAPGRTTVAVGVAAEAARHGARVLLVDADTYGSSVAQTLSLLDEAPGMAAAARAADHGTLDLPGLARLAPEVSPRFRVLTGIPRSQRWPELRAAAVETVLDLSRLLAEVIVVDCGFAIEDDEELSYDTLAPRRNAATLSTLERADDLVVVGAADPVGLQRLVRAVQDVSSVPAPAPRVVVNKVRASAVGTRPERRISEALARFAGMEDLTFLPWDQVTLDGAMLAGCTLAEHAPQSEIRLALAGPARTPDRSAAADTRAGRRRSRGLRPAF
jgi:Mrp family chromosome partitioning ATPase